MGILFKMINFAVINLKQYNYKQITISFKY